MTGGVPAASATAQTKLMTGPDFQITNTIAKTQRNHSAVELPAKSKGVFPRHMKTTQVTQ